VRIIDTLKSRNFWINVLLLLLALILLFFLMGRFLTWYTHGGESITVPDLRGKSVEEAQQILDEKDLRFEIRDSVFAPDKPKLSVVEQNPKPDSKVKRGRRIYILINADQAPKVALPPLTDVPLQQAERMLASYGFKRGKLEYKPDIALNAVLEMQVNGQVVQPGTMFEKGTVIDLVLGDGGKSGGPVSVPDLTGMPHDEAVVLIRGLNLNVGVENCDPGTVNCEKATIYKQSPLPGNNAHMGDAVDIWLH
jgi:eukaryotic-like serine/threonine-protein kinase